MSAGSFNLNRAIKHDLLILITTLLLTALLSCFIGYLLARSNFKQKYHKKLKKYKDHITKLQRLSSLNNNHQSTSRKTYSLESSLPHYIYERKSVSTSSTLLHQLNRSASLQRCVAINLKNPLGLSLGLYDDSQNRINRILETPRGEAFKEIMGDEEAGLV